MNITNQEFLKLYTKQSDDESIVAFDNEIGFSLVRNYPKDTQYFKDGKKIFIKIAIIDDGLFYSVDMTKPNTRSGENVTYTIIDGQEYKNKVTNFFSDKQEPFVFDESKRKIIFKPKNKEFTLNEFVEILVKNHLSDRLFFKRKINFLVEGILKFMFWLSDKHYERIQTSIDRHHFKEDKQSIKKIEKSTEEPFFKYFHISKNIIFTLLLVIFIFALLFNVFPKINFIKKFWVFGEFSLSNPFVVLFIFLILFSSEKFSLWLEKKIKDFFETETVFKKKHGNFIETLHNYQFNNKFKLKL